MKPEELKKDKINDFIRYCIKHKSEVDESFLYDEDLKEFVPDEQNPTYIVLDKSGDIKAAASLIINEYYKRGKAARFRIFHSEVEDTKIYAMLLQAIKNHTDGLEKLIAFVPTINEKLAEYIEASGFVVDRYVYILMRDNQDVPEFTLPEGYEIRPFVLRRDEEVWCSVRNESFAKLKGSETPITPEMAAKQMSGDNVIEGGAMILYHGSRPVGVVKAERDEYEGSPAVNIGPLAIIPEYQGRGLGRQLLRASLNCARANGYDRVILCVNAENERAKALYLQEGFRQVEGSACYRYDLI